MDSVLKNPTVKLIIVLAIIALVFYLLWVFYSKLRKQQELEPIFVRKPQNGKKSGVFSNKLVPLPRSGMAYSMTLWMYVDDWDYKYGQWKHVVHKGDKDVLGSIIIAALLLCFFNQALKYFFISDFFIKFRQQLFKQV